MLPKPKRDANGNITSASICQPIEIMRASPSTSTSISSFYCNLLKVIISYLDASSEYHDLILQQEGMECFISLLSNYSKFHTSVIKNAASALARIVKSGDSSIKERFHDLRGTEILMELSRNGKV